MGVVVTAKYRSFVSDNYQGGSGKPYEDKVTFTVESTVDMVGLFAITDIKILEKTSIVAGLTMCPTDSNYQLISVEVSI